MTKTEFLAEVDRIREDEPSFRYGQTVFNLAASTDGLREITNKLWSGPRDPFYHDARVPAFLAELEPYFDPEDSDD